MKVIRVHQGRAVCPRCDGNGTIYKKKIETIGSSIFICDECEALWEDWNMIFSEHQNLSTYLSSKSLVDFDYSISKGEYDWLVENIEKADSGYFICPLFDITILEGDCYDINMVRGNFIKREILQCFELEISEKFDIDKANRICDNCKHSL